MIYELRIYHAAPGKMKALQQRFEEVTLPLFEKHGVKVTHFWEDIEESNNKIYYVVEYESMDQRNINFPRFQEDPEWIQAKQTSETDGPLVEKLESCFMKNVPFFQ